MSTKKELETENSQLRTKVRELLDQLKSVLPQKEEGNNIHPTITIIRNDGEFLIQLMLSDPKAGTCKLKKTIKQKDFIMAEFTAKKLLITEIMNKL